MAEDLVVEREFQPNTLQEVRTQPESPTPSPASALSLATNAARIAGHDNPDMARPLTVICVDTENPPQKSWGRVVRIQRNIGQQSFFFDIGVDSNGALYINSSSSSATEHVLVVDKDGGVAISTLKVGKIRDLDVPPAGVVTTDVVVDPRTGKLYRQN